MAFASPAVLENDLDSPRRPTKRPQGDQKLRFGPAVMRRREAREAAFERRKLQADKLKEEGNSHFREGRYVEAIRKYNEAAKTVGMRPIIMSNLAAAYLKLQQYELAEWAADCALLHSPSMAKARFRRALARKSQGLNKAAETDLLVVTKNHPDITEAQDELVKVRWQKKKSGDGQRAEPNYDEEFPPFGGEEWDPPLDSDSEDVRHVGNRKACRFHNRGGCGKGARCGYSHAPDDKSVRDEMGQNVCIDYLLGSCKQNQSCSYAHSVSYLLEGWWSSLKEVSAAKKLTDAMNKPDADRLTIAALENTSQFGRLKKARDYRSDLDLYSAMSADVLKSRLKDKARTKANPSTDISTANDRFVLTLCLEDEEMFENINKHLLHALKGKIKVVCAKNTAQAVTCLSAPELTGVIVADGGIIDRKHSNVVSKLVDYVKRGGSVVFGCLFPSFISGSSFGQFFSRNFGLNWERGSYFRTTFFKDPGNDIVKNNPSLDKSYSMKALHVRGISSSSALYRANESSRTQSAVFPSAPITDFDESPAVTIRVGNGFVSFLGDVNAEDSSTNTILAMLGLLDGPLPTPAVPQVQVPGVHSPASTPKKTKGKKKSGKKKTPPSVASPPPSSPSPSIQSSTASRSARIPTSSHDKRFIMQLTLEYEDVVGSVCKSYIDTLQVKVNVRKVTSEARAKELLLSPHLCGVFVTDPGVTHPDHGDLLKKVAAYAFGGGTVVFGGTFASFVQYPDVAPLFSNFDLEWKAGPYTRDSLECNMDENELVETNTFLPNKIYIKGLFLSNVKTQDIVYTPCGAGINSRTESPIVFTKVHKGHVGYIGDVNSEECTKPSLLAMFDLLKPQRVAPKPLPHNFIVVLTQSDTIDEYQQTPLFRKLKERNVEIVTDEHLSDPRLADLFSSRDLLGVLVLDDMFSVPEREWLGYQIAIYAWSGGTVIFGGDFGVMTPPDDFERYLSNNFCLPWKISSATELSVRLNVDNPLIRGLPSAAQQEHVYAEGAFIYDVSPEAMVYKSQPGLGPERATHVPVAYVEVGKGRVAYFGNEEISELDTTLMLGMLKL
ncbi:hypothetical protein D9756_008926 [Leucocoprinus leucothites]|uniref:C3H1-type domain-containing protein n=1 Tax=Leucocoprinus leucothites TaxID=201217 RepID=A0A8H5CXW1_9AGAR|nr:hypothetical protein D9756_008926 [Leucoagaricus leucothites]